MGGVVRRGIAIMVAVGITAAIVAGSRAPYRTDTAGTALLRLSWSGRPERIETCRRVGPEELEARPAHMRQEVECEGRPARYLVRALDGGVALSVDTVTGGGVRGDRAIHMLREFPLIPGKHALVVEISRIDRVTPASEVPDQGDTGKEDLWRPGPADRERREQDEQRRQRQGRLPETLRLAWDAELAPGSVLLVSYDPTTRRLVARTGS